MKVLSLFDGIATGRLALPDNYTEGVSDSRRYSAIGNGWTTDVISYIFKGLKE